MGIFFYFIHYNNSGIAFFYMYSLLASTGNRTHDQSPMFSYFHNPITLSLVFVSGKLYSLLMRRAANILQELPSENIVFEVADQFHRLTPRSVFCWHVTLVQGCWGQVITFSTHGCSLPDAVVGQLMNWTNKMDIAFSTLCVFGFIIDILGER